MAVPKKKKDPVFHVKLKVIPKNPKYKHFYMAGLVAAKDANTASEYSKNEINEWASKAPEVQPDGVDVRLMSCKKLKTDFQFNASNGRPKAADTH